MTKRYDVVMETLDRSGKYMRISNRWNKIAKKTRRIKPLSKYAKRKQRLYADWSETQYKVANIFIREEKRKQTA